MAEPRKIVVFAHVPPPHHGQSYMVQLLLGGLNAPGPDGRPEFLPLHVNARLSNDAGDIGAARWGKFFLLIGYCLRALAFRFREKARVLYYVPAPGKWSALLRDWVVMLLCRPFFRTLVLHWHGTGLADWLETKPRWVSLLTRFLYRTPEASILLARQFFPDAESVGSRRLHIVPNGIPDPCPDFESRILPERRARHAARAGTDCPRPCCHFLYLAHCSREKGVFEALEAIHLLNLQARDGDLPFCRLSVAGAFPDPGQQHEFETLAARINAEHASSGTRPAVTWKGFAGAPEKQALLEACDALLFPSTYPTEGLPVAILEALAFGMPVVHFDWRALPEMIPAPLRYMAEKRSAAALAERAAASMREDRFEALRRLFLECYSLEAHLERMRAVLARPDAVRPDDARMSKAAP